MNDNDPIINSDPTLDRLVTGAVCNPKEMREHLDEMIDHACNGGHNEFSNTLNALLAMFGGYAVNSEIGESQMHKDHSIERMRDVVEAIHRLIRQYTTPRRN